MADLAQLDELTDRFDLLGAWGARSVELEWHRDDDDLPDEGRRWRVTLEDALDGRRVTAWRRGVDGIAACLEAVLPDARRAWWRRTAQHLERVLPLARTSGVAMHVRLLVRDLPPGLPVEPVGVDVLPGGKRGHLFTVEDAEELLDHARREVRRG